MTTGAAVASRKLRHREPNGRPQREREFPPAQIRRLRDAALAGLREPEWGTELGRLYLARRISEAQYAAGKWWTEVAGWYHQAIGVKRLGSPSAELGRRGTPPDPDSPEGQKQVEQDANRAERFFEAHAVLLNAGKGAEKAVRDVCERGVCSVATDDLMALRVGLTALATHRGLTGQNKS